MKNTGKRKFSNSNIAAILKSPSYISLEKALEMYHLIPDVVYTFTSVTTKRRPAEFITPVGRFKYFCIKKSISGGTRSFDSLTVKGILRNLKRRLSIYFTWPRKRSMKILFHSLRFQNTEQLNHENLIAYARKMGVPFVIKAVDLLIKILQEEEGA